MLRGDVGAFAGDSFVAGVGGDADDDAVLTCALAAHAEIIVTGDKDLLVLHPWRDIDILNPAEAVRRAVANKA